MLPYYFLVLAPALISLTGQRSLVNRTRKSAVDVFFVIFLALLFFRAESVGVDVSRYHIHFDENSLYSSKEVVSLILDGEKEAGYLLLSRIVHIFTSDFRWMLIACAMVSVVPIWMMYRDDPSEEYLTVILFLSVAPFAMYFSGLRQAMAMAFVYPVYLYTKQKKLFKTVVFVFLAFLFHRSALILLLFYPIYHLKVRKKYWYFLALPLVGIVYVYADKIFSFLSVFFYDTSYEKYVTDISSTGAYMVTLLLALFFIYSVILPDEGELDGDTKGLRNILLLSVFLQIFSSVHTISMRINYYFLLFVPMTIPRIIRASMKANRKAATISAAVFIIYFTAHFFYKAYTSQDILQIYPYIAMWNV